MDNKANLVFSDLDFRVQTLVIIVFLFAHLPSGQLDEAPAIQIQEPGFAGDRVRQKRKIDP